MQEQQNAADNAEGVEGIKRYIVKDTWKDYEVTLEVNHAVLTPERAKLINDFWTNSEDRLDQCDGDVVKTAIQLFGQEAICTFLRDGGASFGPVPESVAKRQSAELRSGEGWGGEEGGSEYGWCGMRVLVASVGLPCFDELELAEVKSCSSS